VAQDRGWDDVPREFNEIQRRGFHDGMEGAHHDMDNHRTPNVDNRDEYRHPDVPPQVREQYRDAFRRGYQAAYSHMNGMAPPPPPQPVQPSFGAAFGWNGMTGQVSEFQRRGYQEGIVGAQRDMENHRRPDPDNRDEYRNPNVPSQFQDEFREGFRRGYSQTISQAYGVQDRGKSSVKVSVMGWKARARMWKTIADPIQITATNTATRTFLSKYGRSTAKASVGVMSGPWTTSWVTNPALNP
jgi:ribosome modulation factor